MFLNLKIEAENFVIVSQDLFKGRLSAKIPEFQPGTERKNSKELT
jgi:hypothetical protein